MSTVVIAIDGPSGSGKSSTSRAVAQRANWKYLDTGALYRAITWLALKLGSEDPATILAAAIEEGISFNGDPIEPRIFVGEHDVTADIRSARVTDQVSIYSAVPEIREYLLTIQRGFIDEAPRGVVVEGRDIGTVVVPDAPLKIFLYADLEQRALRREREMAEGMTTEIVSASLDARDHIDSTRKISPLRMAEDALEIDSTLLDLPEVVDVIWQWAKERQLLGLPRLQLSDDRMLANPH